MGELGDKMEQGRAAEGSEGMSEILEVIAGIWLAYVLIGGCIVNTVGCLLEDYMMTDDVKQRLTGSQS